jgi:hypothetical protein
MTDSRMPSICTIRRGKGWLGGGGSGSGLTDRSSTDRSLIILVMVAVWITACSSSWAAASIDLCSSKDSLLIGRAGSDLPVVEWYPGSSRRSSSMRLVYVTRYYVSASVLAATGLSLTIASSFRLSSSPELLIITCCNSLHASPYASTAPSKFCALSSKTAVFAFCSALDSMVFLSFSLRSRVRGGVLWKPSSSLVLELLSLLPLESWSLDPDLSRPAPCAVSLVATVKGWLAVAGREGAVLELFLASDSNIGGEPRGNRPNALSGLVREGGRGPLEVGARGFALK